MNKELRKSPSGKSRISRSSCDVDVGTAVLERVPRSSHFVTSDLASCTQRTSQKKCKQFRVPHEPVAHRPTLVAWEDRSSCVYYLLWLLFGTCEAIGDKHWHEIIPHAVNVCYGCSSIGVR